MAKGKHKPAGRANPKQKARKAGDDEVPEPPPRPNFGSLGLVACLAIGANFMANVLGPAGGSGAGGGWAGRPRAGGGGRWGGACPIGVDEARMILTDAAQSALSASGPAFRPRGRRRAALGTSRWTRRARSRAWTSSSSAAPSTRRRSR